MKRLTLAGLILGLAVVGSVGLASLLAPGTARPTPGPVVIRTQPAPATACDDALLEGTLATNDRTGLGVLGTDGSSQGVVWPFGFSAQSTDGGVWLLDADGVPVAFTGDRVRVGGGHGQDDLWFACGLIARLRMP